MQHDHKLAEQLVELAAIFAEINAATGSQDEGWRHRLVAARRNLAAVMGQLAQVFVHPAASDEAASAMAKRFGAMRHAVSLHQSSWPAVGIDPADPAYQASLANARAKVAEFLEEGRRLGMP